MSRRVINRMRTAERKAAVTEEDLAVARAIAVRRHLPELKVTILDLGEEIGFRLSIDGIATVTADSVPQALRKLAAEWPKAAPAGPLRRGARAKPVPVQKMSGVRISDLEELE